MVVGDGDACYHGYLSQENNLKPKLKLMKAKKVGAFIPG
jgi:hypothetical protein